MIYKEFDKKSDLWKNNIFYRIKEDEDKNKCIYLVLSTALLDKYSYLWFENELYLGKIKDLNEWGNIRQEIREKWSDLIYRDINYTRSTPLNVYTIVNNLLQNEGGVKILRFDKIDENTPCGFYCQGY